MQPGKITLKLRLNLHPGGMFLSYTFHFLSADFVTTCPARFQTLYAHSIKKGVKKVKIKLQGAYKQITILLGTN